MPELETGVIDGVLINLSCTLMQRILLDFTLNAEY